MVIYPFSCCFQEFKLNDKNIVPFIPVLGILAIGANKLTDGHILC
jgi:hypothetical protein